MAAERRIEYDSFSLQSAGPNEIHLAVVSTLLNNLLRETVSRDWPLVCLELLDRCPDTEDRQEATDVAAREIPEGVARLSAPLRFRAERTEKYFCPSGKYVNLLYMYSILGRGSFCFNYCLNSAWHGGDQFVALLRCYGSQVSLTVAFSSSAFFGLVSHFPLDNTPKILYGVQVW